MYEVFDCVDGIAVYSTKYKCIAMLLAWVIGMDYNLKSMGYVHYTID